MLFHRNIAIRFSCPAKELTEKLWADAFLRQTGLKRGKDTLLTAVNPTPWAPDAFLPQINICILGDSNGCTLITSFSLQRYVKIIFMVFLCVTFLLECIIFAGTVSDLNADFWLVFLLPAIWIAFLSIGVIQFRKNVKDIVGNLMSLE